jgi:hypothetical protein
MRLQITVLMRSGEMTGAGALSPARAMTIRVASNMSATRSLRNDRDAITANVCRLDTGKVESQLLE